nr:non-ribosomal peptide synthetase [Gloeocapsopsis dulcis]
MSGNGTHTNYPTACIHQLFEAQVSQQPQAIAIRAQKQFTYQELNQGSNQLARYLQRLGIEPEMRVGICLEQTTETVAAMLAVLKAGSAYVPLDPSYPPERLRFLLEDAQVSIVLTHRNLVVFDTKIKVIDLEQEWTAIAQESEENLNTPCSVDQLAYAIYTSGSTGTPKGVMVAHRAVNRLVCQTNYVEITPGDRIAKVANIAFDAATFEIWGALLNGAELVDIERETTLLPTDLKTALRQQHINVMFLTTALFNQTAAEVPDAFQSLKYLLFGGEAANPDRIRTVLQHGKPQHLIHVYGPTENTTFSTWYEVQEVPENATTVPIGQAIANTQVYVLDAKLNPVPAGINGEIYLGGDGLAQGYLNRPELTAEKFIANPFCQDRNLRLYKTGDRACRRADGNIEFLGRIDCQIKIRGFRVELGEIETVLAQHPSVQTAVVDVREVATDRQLIAYVVPQPTAVVSDRELRSFLKTQLPQYMLPAMFVPLKSLPLTTNSKIDRQALPLPTAAPDTILVAPSTSVEKSLVDLWCQLLGRKQVGIHDNFFELGGHSLLATQLISRIRDRFQVEIPLRSLFESPTIAQLAQKIDAVWIKAQVTSDHLKQRREEIEL